MPKLSTIIGVIGLLTVIGVAGYTVVTYIHPLAGGFMAGILCMFMAAYLSDEGY